MIVMSNSKTTTDKCDFEGIPSIATVFDVDESEPYKTQRTVQRYLSQETRHQILQVLLGHPSHLASMTELEYFIPRNRATIREHLLKLEDHKILMQYHHEPNTGSRDLPSDFWGFTEFGVRLLGEYKYLRGLPLMRAVHDNTQKTETVERHENAPRPRLPDAVHTTLSFDEPDTPADVDAENTTIGDLRNEAVYADVAPETADNDEEGGRSLDELF